MNLILLAEAAVAGFAGMWFLEQFVGTDVMNDMRGIKPVHHAAAAPASGDQGAGCAPDANPGGNSPGWYTEGANSSGGSGWTGKAGHHHCDWKKQCCFCTDVKKCIKTGTPPTQPGSCRPDWGTSGYLGGGAYPAKPDFSACPPGTAPPGS